MSAVNRAGLAAGLAVLALLAAPDPARAGFMFGTTASSISGDGTFTVTLTHDGDGSNELGLFSFRLDFVDAAAQPVTGVTITAVAQANDPLHPYPFLTPNPIISVFDQGGEPFTYNGSGEPFEPGGPPLPISNASAVGMNDDGGLGSPVLLAPGTVYHLLNVSYSIDPAFTGSVQLRFDAEVTETQGGTLPGGGGGGIPVPAPGGLVLALAGAATVGLARLRRRPAAR